MSDVMNVRNEITTIWAEVQALHQQLAEKMAQLGTRIASLGSIQLTTDSEVAGVAAETAVQHASVAEVAVLGPKQPGVAVVAAPAAGHHAQVAAVATLPPGRKRPEERGIYPRGKTFWAKFGTTFLGSFDSWEAAVAARKRAYERNQNMKKYGNPAVEVVTLRDYKPDPPEDADPVPGAPTHLRFLDGPVTGTGRPPGQPAEGFSTAHYASKTNQLAIEAVISPESGP